MASIPEKSNPGMDIASLLERASPGQKQQFELGSIDRLKAYGFSMDEIYRFVAPRRTLARRAARQESLTVSESDGLARVLHVCEMAERIFDSWRNADGWLREPCQALNGVLPIDLLQSETGARLVEEELHRIEHGIFF